MQIYHTVAENREEANVRCNEGLGRAHTDLVGHSQRRTRRLYEA